MMNKKFSLPEMESRRFIQDPGFLDDPHALWAAMKFLSIAGGAIAAVESVKTYAGLIRKKRKTCGPSVPISADALYLH
jgi:hypothetical protein